ncbi:type II secretion system F family protein, partial [bacterium]
MAKFNWQGRAKDGASQSGLIESQSEATAKSTLAAQGIKVTSLKPVREFSLALPFMKPKVKTKDIVVFTRQFATMIDAGLPLVQCLEILSDQQPNPAFKKVLNDVKGDVEAGSTFAEALGKHPSVFDRLFVNLVAAGEVGGILDTILNRLATYIEKNMNLKKKVRGAMVYPASVVVVAVLVIAVILIYVIPVFQNMFAGAGKELPAPT